VHDQIRLVVGVRTVCVDCSGHIAEQKAVRPVHRGRGLRPPSRRESRTDRPPCVWQLWRRWVMAVVVRLPPPARRCHAADCVDSCRCVVPLPRAVRARAGSRRSSASRRLGANVPRAPREVRSGRPGSRRGSVIFRPAPGWGAGAGPSRLDPIVDPAAPARAFDQRGEREPAPEVRGV
jgi:hypothetical protein